MQKKVQPAPNKGLKTIIALITGYSIIYMDKNMVSTAIIPIAHQFHLTSTKTGFIVSAFFLSYSLMSIPSGWLVDKLGPKRVLLLSLGLTAVFAFAFGLSSGLLFFMLMRFGAGIGHSGYPSGSSKAIAENFDSEKRVFMQSAILTTTGIGAILAGTIGTTVISYNWRYGYALLGLLFILAFVIIAVGLPNRKVVATPTAQPKKQRNFLQVLTNRNVLTLAIAMVLVNVAAYGFSSWTPTYLKTNYHLSLKTTGLLIAINAIWQVVGSLGAGYVLSKWFAGQQKKFIFLSAIIGAIAIIMMVLNNNLWFAMILMAVINLTIVATFTATFTWAQKLFSEAVIGSAVGVLNFGGTMGGFLSAPLVGSIADKFNGSFVVAFIVLAVILFATSIVTALVKVQK